jgi:hypothetical protein
MKNNNSYLKCVLRWFREELIKNENANKRSVKLRKLVGARQFIG